MLRKSADGPGAGAAVPTSEIVQLHWRHGMRRKPTLAIGLVVITGCSACFLGWSFACQGRPPRIVLPSSLPRAARGQLDDTYMEDTSVVERDECLGSSTVLHWAEWKEADVLPAGWRWLSTTPRVLAASGLGLSAGNPVSDSLPLSHRLSQLCLALEGNAGSSRSISNVGGWQSGDLTGLLGDAGARLRESLGREHAEALSEFLGLLHAPLASFLHAQLEGKPPTNGIEMLEELRLVAVPDELWANVNRQGHWNARHNHGAPTASTVVSGIYYPRSCSDAKLRIFLEEGEEESQIEILPEEGLLLLFSPDVEHEVARMPEQSSGVDAGESDDTCRLSFAFNLRVRWLESPLLAAAASGGQSDDFLQRLLSEAGQSSEGSSWRSEASSLAVGADRALGLGAAHLAAEAGHVATLNAMLNVPVSDHVDSRQEFARRQLESVSLEGWSPLGLAADRGHCRVVDFLLTSGHDGSATASGGTDSNTSASVAQTPIASAGAAPLWQAGRCGRDGALSIAATRGNLQIVKRLLADVEADDKSPALLNAPMVLAVTNGHSPVLSELLTQGADPLGEGEGGRTLLHEAAGKGHVAVVQMLRDAGVKEEATDGYGACALHEAAAKGHVAAVQVLLAGDEGLVRSILNVADDEGMSPLHWAAREGHSSVARALVAAGADLMAVASSGGPLPLYSAAVGGHAELVDLLAGLGADAGAPGLLPPEDSPAAEPLVSGAVAVRGGPSQWHRLRAARFLASAHFEAEPANELGATALHVAASAGHLAIAEVLARLGAEADLEDASGAQPLHWAASNGHGPMVEHLLGRGVEVDAVDSNGAQPLHDAAWGGHAAIADMLLNSRASANAKDNEGRSALHAAAAFGLEELAEILLASGANATATDASGRSPYDMVVGRPDLEELFGRSP